MSLVHIEDGLAWATAAGTFGAFVAAAWNLHLVSSATERQARAQQLANLPGLYSRYLDQEIAAPRALRPLRQVRVAPVQALRRHLSGDPVGTKAWQAFAAVQVQDGHWQQRFAYELSLSVQRVGLHVMAAGVPLDVVVADAARRLVEDWAICRPTIERIRTAPAWQLRGRRRSSDPVDYHRRHGEWIMVICAAVLLTNDQEDGLVVRHALGVPLDTPIAAVRDHVRRQERTIRRLEGAMVSGATARVARRFTRGRGWGG